MLGCFLNIQFKTFMRPGNIVDAHALLEDNASQILSKLNSVGIQTRIAHINVNADNVDRYLVIPNINSPETIAKINTLLSS
jgi:hypothetical protein